MFAHEASYTPDFSPCSIDLEEVLPGNPVSPAFLAFPVLGIDIPRLAREGYEAVNNVDIDIDARDNTDNVLSRSSRIGTAILPPHPFLPQPQ